MEQNKSFLKQGWRIVAGLLVVTAVLTLISHFSTTSIAQADPSGAQQQFLPIIGNGPPLFCRFGVNVNQLFSSLMIEELPLGWYVDYRASATPESPQGAKYVPIIRLSQTGPNASDFTYNPSGAELMSTIAGNPGGDWFIGNEPDRRDFQDDMEPHVYAAAYHELYHLIKTADPTARIFAGTIVQPTPLRLQYLDMVLDSYELQNGGVPLPADGWSIHNFILNEVSCDYDDTNCWGAEVPPGINAPFGQIIAINDNDNINMFQERIVAFRQWMFDNGYGSLPLSVSEYGVLMPEWLGFPATRVNTFMNASVDYMLSATDPVLGDPHDGRRLVQNFSWYSTGAPNDPFNGYLFEGTNPPWHLSSMGENYAALIAEQEKAIDYYPTSLISKTVSVSNSVTVTLEATIANSGNTTEPFHTVIVRFYNGDPDSGGTQLGSDQTVMLPGCGYHQTVSIDWPDPDAGDYQVFVVADASNLAYETNEQNNKLAVEVTVPPGN
jgi:hypothetical protein